MFTSNLSNVREVVARTLRVENSQCPPRRNVAIETLSDDVLLEIFDFCLDKDEDMGPQYDPDNEEDERCLYDAWYALVHVCQRWRYVVFESPRRLNLRLHCTRRRVREMLGVWPALPIIIWDMVDFTSNEDNIIAALEHRDRVCEIKLRCLTSSQSKTLVPLMQESFPALTKLQIQSCLVASNGLLVLADSFLGGSAPHLRFLCLESISFPAFPNLLRSASNLAYLYLDGTPSRYISPEMVAALSTLSKLEVMHILFRHPDFDSDSELEDRAPPPLTRSVLPALKVLVLGGDTEYLDDFVARIDVPSINSLRIEFINRPFFAGDFFHLPQFIGRIKKLPAIWFCKVPPFASFHECHTFPAEMDARFLPGRLSVDVHMRRRWSTCVSGGSFRHLINVTHLQHRKRRYFFYAFKSEFTI
ncbi:hypothetical protein BGY98DRAFT_651495 [Russula aff. rugulosa BPL654]|nr:hypothetical protein BGY98DRAFT_651495 [Russula aff. rugulosa BPL654]